MTGMLNMNKGINLRDFSRGKRKEKGVNEDGAQVFAQDQEMKTAEI